MGRVKIFEVSSENVAEPERGEYEEAVGRFRSGYQDADGKPHSLDEWRVTTGDPTVAKEIAELFGGEPTEWETKGTEHLEVRTEAPAVVIQLDSADAIQASMKLMSSDFKTIRECDGIQQTEDFGCADCVCPSDLKERKAAARNGTGCKPSIAIYFHLDANPELGKFRYYGGAWGLMEQVPKLQDDLDKVGGPARVRFQLTRIEFTNQQGINVSYVIPKLAVLGEVT